MVIDSHWWSFCYQMTATSDHKQPLVIIDSDQLSLAVIGGHFYQLTATSDSSEQPLMVIHSHCNQLTATTDHKQPLVLSLAVMVAIVLN